MQEGDSDSDNTPNRDVDLLAVASHEIRTPLGAVLTTAEALLQSGLDEQQTKYATTLRDAAVALLTLSNTLLDATASADLKDPDIFRPVELVASVVALYEARARAKGLDLSFECAVDANYAVSGYPGPMRQVVTNLVDNALKYTGSGHVGVTLSRQADGPIDRIIIRVSDSGSGIADADRERIFNPYSRLNPENQSGSRIAGQGLGLWVAKRTVEKLSGDLSVESSGPEGTTFCFAVPVAPHSAAREINPATQTDRRDNSGETGYSILVVDDNDAALTLAEVVISAFGWAVTTAPSGERALEIISGSADTFDCVLTDLAMPEMNGIDLARAIDALDLSKRIPVLAISAVDPAHFGAADETSIHGYVPKPYTPDLLYRTLSDVIQAGVKS